MADWSRSGALGEVGQEDGLGLREVEVAQQVGCPLTHRHRRRRIGEHVAHRGEIGLGIDGRQGCHGVHPGLVGKVVASDHVLDIRVEVAEPEVADDVDAQRDLARLRRSEKLSGQLAGQLRAVSSSPAPRS